MAKVERFVTIINNDKDALTLTNWCYIHNVRWTTGDKVTSNEFGAKGSKKYPCVVYFTRENRLNGTKGYYLTWGSVERFQKNNSELPLLPCKRTVLDQVYVTSDPFTITVEQATGDYLQTGELLPEQTDLIDKQDHYTATGIEPINLMFENFNQEEYQGFLQGNILKYMLRYKRKNGLEDLKKAKTYLTWLIEDVEKRGI